MESTSQPTAGVAMRQDISAAAQRIAAAHGERSCAVETAIDDSVVTVVLRGAAVSGDQALQLRAELFQAVEQVTTQRIVSFLTEREPDEDASLHVFVLDAPVASKRRVSGASGPEAPRPRRPTSTQAAPRGLRAGRRAR